jgi:hypothetical protein
VSAPGGNRAAFCVTDTRKLSRLLGDGVHGALAGYLDDAKEHGVDYAIVDLAGLKQDYRLEDVISFLKARVQAHGGTSAEGGPAVLILGDANIVPMAVFANQVDGDPDQDLDTDYPFAALCTDDPWAAPGGGLGPLLPVGRLPLGAGFGLADLEGYRKALRAFATTGNPRTLLGLSAQAWQPASEQVFRSIEGEGLQVSPPIGSAADTEQLIRANPDFLYFNLHGSDQDPGWFGQQAADYPRVVVPGTLARSSRPVVVGVEACYGTRFQGLDKNTSILLHALATGCVALAGSSRIAFGPPSPPIKLADVVIQGFLQAMIRGKPAGMALLQGRAAVLEDGSDRARQRKTFLAFNLFGDPLAALPASGKSAGAAARPGPLALAPMKLPMPDVLGMVRTAIAGSQMRVKLLMDAHVGRAHPGLKGVEPAFYQGRTASGGELYRFVYSRKAGPLLDLVMLDAYPDGTLRAELLGK